MLHVVGNICRDTTLFVDRFPEPGETLVARDSWTGWGGKGLNQAVAAARAGAEVMLHAAIGLRDCATVLDDLVGEAWPVLRLEPVSRPSDTSTVLVRQDGENLIVSATACAQAFDPTRGDDPLRVAHGDTLLMQGNLGRRITEVCLDHARRQGARTVLNPSPLWDAPIDWHLIDLVVLNRLELRRITGLDDPAAGTGRLRDLGAGTVVVTCGAHGALLVDGTRSLAIPAPQVEVRDTSGAGDIFCGALVARLGTGTPDTGVIPETALVLATAAAALSVTRPGALASCPTADEFARLAASDRMGSAA